MTMLKPELHRYYHINQFRKMDCQKHFQFILKEKDDLISVKSRIVARRFPCFTDCQNVLIEKN